MGKEWDRSGIAFHTELWQELYRVLKPGAHILVAGIARTHHRMWIALEDAGFEIRDGIYHVFGSGFPKSTDISKQLDKKRSGDLEQIRNILREKLKNYDRHDLVNKLNVTVRQIDHWIKQQESQPQIPSIEKWNLIKTFVDIPEKDELKWMDTRITEYNYEVLGIKTRDAGNRQIPILQGNTEVLITAPTSEEAIKWNGWGTALKPSVEIWCLARKPISERNIGSNVLKWSVGGINVDKCRISVDKATEPRKKWEEPSAQKEYDVYPINTQVIPGLRHTSPLAEYSEKGRFPANLILECCCEEDELVEGKAYSTHRNWKRDYKDESPSAFSLGVKRYKGDCIIHTNSNCVCRMLDEQSGELVSGGGDKRNTDASQTSMFGIGGENKKLKGENDKGGASRFFYQAKASQKERYFYCMICKQAYPMKERDKHIHNALEKAKYKYLEFHPTQKPLQLIQYITRLITPPHGTVLDLFMGTGTTLVAAEQEGFNSIGVDSKLEYCRIAERRLKNELMQLKINQERSTIEKIGF